MKLNHYHTLKINTEETWYLKLKLNEQMGGKGMYVCTLDLSIFCGSRQKHGCFHNHDRHFKFFFFWYKKFRQSGIIPVAFMQCSIEKCVQIKQFFILRFFCSLSPKYCWAVNILHSWHGCVSVFCLCLCHSMCVSFSILYYLCLNASIYCKSDPACI